jgi:polyhydroxybutyrate depolymerase
MAWWARAMFKVGGVTLSAPATAEYFARRNGITTEPVVSLLPVRHEARKGTRMEETAYRETGREPITLYSVHGGGHTVPGATPAPAMLGRTGADLPTDEIVGDLIVALKQSADPHYDSSRS